MPAKALNIIKYIALGLCIVETVLDDPDKKGEEEFPPTDPTVQQKEKEVPDEMEKFYRISLINSLIGFKPVNLLGSCNIDGSPNLSIISSAFHLGANPPLIGLVMRPQREHNDTLKNIQATGQYTLNNVLPDWYK